MPTELLFRDDAYLRTAQARVLAAGEHVGLAIMQERTARLPGQLVIESEPDEGTRIVLMFTAPPPVARDPAPRG